MITIPGTLYIETCQFRLTKKGLLQTSIGEFEVDYDQLDQLEEGQYHGYFEIQKFQIVYDAQQSSIHVKQVVSISNIALTLFENKTQSAIGKKTKKRTIDEISQESTMQHNLLLEQAETVTEATDETFVEEIVNSDDKELFGTIWPLGERVQLDSTIDRETLALQIKRLRELDYYPNKAEQAWYKAA